MKSDSSKNFSVSPLDWDSHHFGVSVWQVQGASLSEGELNDALLTAKAERAKLVYWEADESAKPSRDFLSRNGGSHVDTKLVFKKQLTSDARPLVPPSGYTLHINPSLSADIEELAIQAGKYSRFKKDPKIRIEKFEELYRAWVRKAGVTLVLFAKDGSLAGLVRISFQKKIGQIDLIATSEAHRNRGLGSFLIRAAHKEMKKAGMEEATVVTQAENVAASELYRKAGYEAEALRPRYHFWFEEEPRPQSVTHDSEAYDPRLFNLLAQMQTRHFWYLGRHRFIFWILKRLLKTNSSQPVKAIDLGGGAGGWIRYLKENLPENRLAIALGDSSEEALVKAKETVGQDVECLHINLLDTRMKEQWDVIFLLDVLEHVSNDAKVLSEIYAALKPGGFLVMTTPALSFFWSKNDEYAGHCRRYSRSDLKRLALAAGFQRPYLRYFMFFLSPLLVISRVLDGLRDRKRPEEKYEYLARTHRPPPPWLNQVLRFIFSLETPLGHYLPFPFGTSVLGVFRKRDFLARKTS